MGYTHYWEGSINSSDNNWEEFLKESDLILSTVSKRIKIDYSIDNAISLNGIGADAHEDFYFSKSDSGFNFCKTARKPYDLAVVSILLLAASYFKGVEFSSDGNINDHQEGIKLLESLNLPYKAIGKSYLL